MRHHAGIVIAMPLLLATCQGPPPEKVFVPVACIPAELGPALAGLETKESLAAIKSGPKRYTRLAADWATRFARMAQTEPVIAECRKIPSLDDAEVGAVSPL